MAGSDRMFKAKDAEIKTLLEELSKTRNKMNELLAKNADLTQGYAVASGKLGTQGINSELQRREQQLQQMIKRLNDAETVIEATIKCQS